MKNILILFVFILCFQADSFSQSLNIDNNDSCKLFMCSKAWVMKTYSKEAVRKMKGNGIVGERDSVIDKIVFYRNGTYVKKVSMINDTDHRGKEEKGTWSFEGKPSRYSGDVNQVRDIALSVKIRTGISGYSLRLLDGAKFKVQHCPVCPLAPYLFYPNTPEAEYFSRE